VYVMHVDKLIQCNVLSYASGNTKGNVREIICDVYGEPDIRTNPVVKESAQRGGQRNNRKE